MEWWSFLWLNEGFARYLEHRAVDHIYPEWKIWESFVAEVFAQAQNLDALETSHPVEVTVNHPDEVNEIFGQCQHDTAVELVCTEETAPAH
jgi:aminopeptidase N